MNINNKIKKFFGGNWGHPRKYIKRNTEIDKDFFDDKPCNKNKRKKKKKKPIIYKWKHCPFCDEELPLIKKEKYIWNNKYSESCPNCSAIKVPECPCCKRETWYLDGIFKHQDCILNCGFVGKKLKRGDKNANR